MSPLGVIASVVQPSQVSIFCGVQGALICTCAAVMSLRRHDELRHTGGLILAPVGYYQSLRLIPAIFGGDIEAVADLDGDAVSTWLASARRRTGRIVYIPLVNNADGSVVSRTRACSIFIRFGKQGSTLGGLLGWGYRVTEARADGGLE